VDEVAKVVVERGQRKTRQKDGFVLNFGFRFLLLQSMESTSIYRGWKRDTLSLLRTNLGL
jgi:hypothetical protein